MIYSPQMMLKCIATMTFLGLLAAFQASFASSLNSGVFEFEIQADTTKADSIKKQSEKLPMDPGRVVEYNTTEGTWMSLDISPDGRHIVFDLMGDIYRIPAEGGEAEQLTDGMAFDTHPRYSPDGKYLLYTSDADGEENLYYLNLEDTTDVTQLTKGENTQFTNAEWTPDGNYIVASKGGLTPKLWLIHKDGGKGAALVDEPSNLKITDPAVGPDGRFIYFSQRTGGWSYNAGFPEYQIGVYDREDGSRRKKKPAFLNGHSQTQQNWVYPVWRNKPFHFFSKKAPSGVFFDDPVVIYNSFRRQICWILK